MVGERLREARIAQNLSLTQVASKAKISVATLSRIETNKQGLDLGTFMTLLKILHISPQDVLGEEEANGQPPSADLAAQITSLDATSRTELWRELATARRASRSRRTRPQIQQMAAQIDELLAQIEFIREEMISVRKRMRRA